jgi:hypothetical protein
MSPRAGFDPASLIAGVIVIAVGGILLACGLTGPPRSR